MLIGLTYDLRDEYLAAGFTDEETAEFDRADTIDAIDNALQSLGHQTNRVGHARQLVERLAIGHRWDLVFNICEGLRGSGRESQVPAILDVYEIPYTFSDTAVMSISLDKGMTKCVVQNSGVPTPRSVVINDVHDLAHVPPLGYPLFAKPVAEGTGKGVTSASRVCNSGQLHDICDQLLRRYEQPVLVEEYLPGREFTVGVLGTGNASVSLGTLEIVLLDHAEPDVYSYVNKERCEELVEYRLVKAGEDEQVAKAEQIALLTWRTLRCRDAGRIDLRCDAAGEPQFLEVNPLSGMHPFHSDLPMLATAVGMSYIDLIRCIVESASLRCGTPVRSSSSTAGSCDPSPVIAGAEERW